MHRKKPDPERIDEENPEITPEELRRARPAGGVLPELIGQKATDADELMRGNTALRPGESQTVSLREEYKRGWEAGFKAGRHAEFLRQRFRSKGSEE